MAALLQLALLTLLISAAQSNVPEPDTIEEDLFFYQHQIKAIHQILKTECPDLIRFKRELYHDGFTSLHLEAAKIAYNCQEHYERGSTTPGVYLIDPSSSNFEPFDVWCDFLDGHGWTVFQKRFDGSIDFYQDWSHYKKGFGTVTKEYWLGLDKIHALTQTNRKLNILVKAANGTILSGTWSSFIIGSEGDNYKLSVSSAAYSGSLNENGLSYSNGMSFSTKDRDHDEARVNCATYWHGAWWYKNCGSNLNGSYDKTDSSGIFWHPLYQLKETVMRVSRD
ncbi:ryncolin-1-like [Watersipora subatra]|uniref:ryncolin-1-like n=1 Tax=Watersipora subatra TaxID=2589382 RepID=UPI00355B334C